MSKSLVLRCQFSGGRKVLNGLTTSSKLSELLEAVSGITGFPANKQRVKTGFPPKELDLSNSDKVCSFIENENGQDVWKETEN